MDLNVLIVGRGRGRYFTYANKSFCINDHGIEVPSNSEQREPAEIDTLPSQLQSPPNLSALASIHCNFHPKLERM